MSIPAVTKRRRAAAAYLADVDQVLSAAQATPGFYENCGMAGDE